MRLYGIHWDEGFPYTPHPDERAILMKAQDMHFPKLDQIGTLLDSEKSPLNPRWFPYGTFPIYVLKITESITSTITEQTIDLRTYGRLLSSLADLGTIIGTSLLALKAFGSRAAVLAALLTAFAVLHIQLAHFFAFDTFAAFFATWATLFAYKYAQEGKTSNSIYAAVFVGLGMACKISLLPIIGMLLAAHIYYIVRSPSLAQNLRDKLIIIGSHLCLSLFTCLVVFIIAQPYAILDWSKFISDITEQSEMVRRIRDYPYTRQYIDTTPYLYQFIQLGKWGLGWPLTIISVTGLFWLITRKMSFIGGTIMITLAFILPAAILLFNNSSPSIALACLLSIGILIMGFIFYGKANRPTHLIACWVIPYLIITCSFEVKFFRYMLPILPMLILLGSGVLIHQIEKSIGLSQKAWTALTCLTVLITMFYGIATLGIYSDQHPAVRASQWLNQNAKDGSLVLKEHWEEGLPNLHGFTIEEQPIYEPDNDRKIGVMSDQLNRADYIVLFSNRLYGTVTRLDERYPLMKGYYNALFTGQLGYTPVLIETSYMNLFGWNFYEDTFKRPSVPDPSSLIPDTVRLKGIDVGFADESFSVYDHPKVIIFEKTKALSLNQIKSSITSTSDALKDSSKNALMMSDERSSDQRDGGTWQDIIHTGSPLSKLPVLTWLLTIQIIAICSLPITIFIFGNLRFKGYLLSKILGLLVVCFIAWLLPSLGVLKFSSFTVLLGIISCASISMAILVARYREILQYIRQNWTNILILELLFLSAFFIFLLIRMANPDLWHPYRGGEKPMDIAYLNAVLKSSYMPPYDPWFAGGYMNYYYWGQFIVASLIHLTGIPTELSYNLAIPTLFAMTVGCCFTIGSSIVNIPWGKKSLYISSGILAFVFVCVIGNLDGFHQIQNIVHSKLLGGGDWLQFDFWKSSRMMPPDPPGFEITEFPFFTFLFADLHAHLIAIPFTLLVLGICLSIVKTGYLNNYVRFQEIATLVLLGLGLGVLRAINTWDFPTYLLISLGSIGIYEFLRNGGLSLLVIFRSVLKTTFSIAIAFLLFLPYTLSTETYFDKIEYTTNTTTFNQIISINGLFFFSIAASCLVIFRPILSTVNNKFKQFNFSIKKKVVPSRKKLGLLLLIFTYLCLLVMGVSGYPMGGAIPIGLALALLVILMTLYESSKTPERRPELLFACLLAIGGLSIIVGLDIWRVEGDIDRMNSVFKFYLQAWVLLALSSVYFIYRLFESIFNTTSTFRYIFAGTFTILLLISLIYPVMGTKDRLRDRFEGHDTGLTIDGYAYTEKAIYRDPKGNINLQKDMEGIYWLRENISGSPVVLEGVTPTYRWGGRVSIHTGLPTVIGWEWHQEQQRWGTRELVDRRIKIVDEFYTSPSPEKLKELADNYGVEYIYLGQVEDLYYPPDGLNHLRSGMAGLLSTVFETDAVHIMQVNKTKK